MPEAVSNAIIHGYNEDSSKDVTLKCEIDNYRVSILIIDYGIGIKNIEEAKTLFAEATKKIDQACTKGVIKANTASRKKSSLSKKLNTLK